MINLKHIDKKPHALQLRKEELEKLIIKQSFLVISSPVVKKKAMPVNILLGHRYGNKRSIGKFL